MSQHSDRQSAELKEQSRLLADDVARVHDQNQDLLRSTDELSRECRMLRDIPLGGDVPADLQEIRALRGVIEQHRSDVEVLRRELRRSREETVERTNVAATLQMATELYSQELTAAALQQKLSSKGEPRPVRLSSTSRSRWRALTRNNVIVSNMVGAIGSPRRRRASSSYQATQTPLAVP